MGILDTAKGLFGGADTAAERARLISEWHAAREQSTAESARLAARAVELERQWREPERAANRAAIEYREHARRATAAQGRLEAAIRALPLPPPLARLSRDMDAHAAALRARGDAIEKNPITPGEGAALNRKLDALGAARRATAALELQPLDGEAMAAAVDAIRGPLELALAAPDIDPVIAAEAATAARRQQFERGVGW